MLSKLAQTSKAATRAAALVAPRSLVTRARVPTKLAQAPRIVATQARKASNLSAPQAPPPFPTVIVYNQSKHASQSVIADIRAVWGSGIRILQTIEDGLQRLPNVDAALYIGTKKWGDMPHLEERLNAACSQDNRLHADRAAGGVCFMPGWSAFAESAEAAVAVQKLGLVWPGTEPGASVRLEKIGFKRICAQVGAPTPTFTVLAEEDSGHDLNDPVAKEECVQSFMKSILDMKTSEPGLIKSIHGGGGKGTAHLPNPSNP